MKIRFSFSGWRSRAIIFPLMISVLGATNASAQPEVDRYAGLRLNEIQLIGSHNSYKPGIEPALWKIIQARDSASAASLQYGHIALTAQLNLGLRNLELDVVHDPLGGHHLNPLGLQLVRQAGGTPEPFDTAGDLRKPGLKVFHVQDIDFRSHHLLFTDCLKELRQWSQSHPGHLPVIITINAKDGIERGLRKLLPFTHDALDSIDMEIRQVFRDDQLITPDLVRGNYDNLEQAVLQKGWPVLKDVAGRFLFVLDEKGIKQESYKQGHPGLKGKAMFVNAPEGTPETGFMILNNPVDGGIIIQTMVRKGYLVRTRADADTREARNNDYSKFRAAMASGAQIITTDYYMPSQLFPSTYRVNFDGHSYVRKNPLNASEK